jgi:rhodanese-related sulfurtransferase
MTELNQDKWRDELASHEEAIIIDVRSPQECAAGIIPGAMQINIMDAAAFMEKIEGLDKSKPTFLYCHAGGRSAQACMIMDSKGFSDTYNLIGGFSQWNGDRSTP